MCGAGAVCRGGAGGAIGGGGAGGGSGDAAAGEKDDGARGDWAVTNHHTGAIVLTKDVLNSLIISI